MVFNKLKIRLADFKQKRINPILTKLYDFYINVRFSFLMIVWYSSIVYFLLYSSGAIFAIALYFIYEKLKEDLEDFVRLIKR